MMEFLTERTRRWDAIICVLLVVAGILVFAPAARYGFIRVDDVAFITDNPEVNNGLTWSGLKWAFTATHEANWMPLTWITHMIDCEIHGIDEAPHHVMSLVLHLACAVLLFLAFRRMTGARWRSAFVAGAFLLHPLHVESAVWVAERKGVLSGFFFMGVLLVYGGYARRPGVLRYAAVLVLLACGLMAKPIVVTTGCVLLLLDVWPLGRLRWRGRVPGPGIGAPASLGRLVLEKLPLLVLAAASSAVTVAAQQQAGAMHTLGSIPMGTRLINALASTATYLVKTVYPSGLAIYYPYSDELSPWPVAGAAIFLTAVTVLAVALVRSRPYLAVGWFWYLGMLAPVSGLVRVGEFAMADRYTYLPLIGIFIMIAWGAPDLLGRSAAARRAMAAASIAALCACAVVSARQVRLWRSSEAILGHALRVTRDNWFAHGVLGLVRKREGDLDRAAAHWRQALRIEPHYVEGHINLGVILEARGKLRPALDHYLAARKIRPEMPEAHTNLGNILLKLRNPEAALPHHSKAVELRPEDPVARVNLGATFLALRKPEAAETHFREALQAKPEFAEAHFNLGDALRRQGRHDEAAKHYRRAMEAFDREGRGSLRELAAKRIEMCRSDDP